MNTLAFLLYHSGRSGPVDLVINFFIYTLAAVIIILLLRKFAAELGIDSGWMKIISLIVLLCIVVILLTGCAGYGVGGGLSYTDASGATYSGNLNVTKYSDGKTIVQPAK